MARKIMNAGTDDNPPSTLPRPSRRQTGLMGVTGSSQQGGGAMSSIGALKGSLAMQSAHSVQMISSDLIDFHGYQDRLSEDPYEDERLRLSIERDGQHLPILVTPSQHVNGRFDVVYGRRRLRALKALGRDAMAIVRDLDAREMGRLQGIENTMRLNLSFADKSMFLGELIADGIEMRDAGEILNVSDRHLQRMRQVYEIVGPDCLKMIGSAPNTGRRGWAEIIQLMELIGIDEGRKVIVEAVAANPDDRVQAALTALRGATGVEPEAPENEPSERRASSAAPKGRQASCTGSRAGGLLVRSRTKTDFGEVRVKSRADKVQLEIEGSEALADWIIENMDTVIAFINEKHSSAEGSK